ALPRPPRHDKPDPRAELHRDGDPPRLHARGRAWSRRRRRVLRRPGDGDRLGARVGVRAVWRPAPSRLAPLRRQARDHRGRGSGDLGAPPDRRKGNAAGRGGSRGARAFSDRRERDRPAGGGRARGAPRAGRPGRVGGGAGAVLATVGIFLPSFVFVAASRPLLPKIRASRWTAAFLDGVNVAALGLMAAVTWELARAAVIDWLTALLALVAAAVLIRFEVNSVWLILGGGVVGLLYRLIAG